MNEYQKSIVLGLAKIDRKHYTTSDLVEIIKRLFSDLRSIADHDLEKQIAVVLYQ